MRRIASLVELPPVIPATNILALVKGTERTETLVLSGKLRKARAIKATCQRADS